MVHRLPVPHNGTSPDHSDVDPDLFLDLTPTPEHKTFRVTRHMNTELVDWELSVSKKCFILGDSNLARIPAFSILDLQIESCQLPPCSGHNAEGKLPHRS